MKRMAAVTLSRIPTCWLAGNSFKPHACAIRDWAWGDNEQGTSKSRDRVKNWETWSRASRPQLPNQSTTHRLNKAGDVAARSRNSPLAGFIVKTTWRLRWTRIVNHLNNSSLESNTTPSCKATSRQAVMRDNISSPSYKPGTSPFANNAFIRSKNPVDKIFDSSKIKHTGWPFTPAMRITWRRSSSKLSNE